jgi:hypothetical protein
MRRQVYRYNLIVPAVLNKVDVDMAAMAIYY